MPTLLVVDDEPSILYAFRRAFRDREVEVLTAEAGAEGLELARERRPDVVVLDVHLPDLNGLEMLRRLRALDGRSPVVFISGRGSADDAIEAMKLGAYDYLLKPLDVGQVRDVVGRALAVGRLMQVPAVVAVDDPTDDRADVIIARCPAMQEVVKAIGRVADRDVTVLITGESGAGKELIARALYQHSRRADKPFLAINCAAIPETLLESELFGHEKGAFTGADRRRIGKFEQCSGGTVLLDEIGDMTPLTQSKLLRVLQDQRFERVGGNETIRTDVRILAATNRDLAAAVAAGRFRQDLYYRLGVFTVALPPLRDRGEDLPLLVNHYVRRTARELAKEVASVAPETMEALRRHSWPGNVRELQSVLLAAVLHAAGPVLLPEFLPPLPAADAGAAGPAPGLEHFIDARLAAGTQELYAEAVWRLEAALLPRVLRHTHGNQLQAAKILGITRGSLRTKLRELGIRIDRTVAGAGRLPVVAPRSSWPLRDQTPAPPALPIRFPQAILPASRPAPALHIPRRTPGGRRMSEPTILLVDDDEVLSQVLRRVLAREGYDVVRAGSIAQGLEAARQYRPALGLLDLSLPDGDGIELAKKLRAEGVDCPFILITAYPLRLRDNPELGGGFTRVLTKPLNLDELRDAVGAALTGAASGAPAAREAAEEGKSAAPRLVGDSPTLPLPFTLPAPATPQADPAAGGRRRGLLLGGVIVAGLAFFLFVVVFPALGLPGVADWFGHSAPATAPAPEAPAATLVQDSPDTLRLAPDVADRFGVKSEAVGRPKTMETLTLSGGLNFDPEYLTHVHPLFPGEVVEVGPYEPEEPTSLGRDKRPLRFGDRVKENQLLAVLWSKDLGEKKNDLVEGLAKLWTDQESLSKLEDLYKDLATSEANVRLQRAQVANDLSTVERARNALRIWRLTDEEIGSVEAEARKIYEERTRAVKAGDKTPVQGGDWKRWARLEVRARMPGTIVELNVPRTGELVDPSQDLFKIADMTHLVAQTYAYEQDLPLLRSLPLPIPWAVKVTADPANPNSRDRVLKSDSAYEVGPTIDPNQHTALVIGKVDNPDRGLRAGQFVTAAISVPPPGNMVEIPADAIDEDGSPDGSVVFVQPDANTPQYAMKRVNVARRLQGRVYVLSEPGPGDDGKGNYEYLHVGDRVVTAGVVVLKSTLDDLRDREKAAK